jgi:hypothetical protein
MQMLMQVCASSVSRDGLTNFLEGHFTQLVWAASRHFGIGKARSRSGKIVVVASDGSTSDSGRSISEST